MRLAKLQAKTAARCTFARCAESLRITVRERRRANASSSSHNAGEEASMNTGISPKSTSRPRVKVCIG